MKSIRKLRQFIYCSLSTAFILSCYISPHREKGKGYFHNAVAVDYFHGRDRCDDEITFTFREPGIYRVEITTPKKKKWEVLPEGFTKVVEKPNERVDLINKSFPSWLVVKISRYEGNSESSQEREFDLR